MGSLLVSIPLPAVFKDAKNSNSYISICVAGFQNLIVEITFHYK